MVDVIRVGSWFWTVTRNKSGGLSSSLLHGLSPLSGGSGSKGSLPQPTPTHHHIPNHAHGGHLHALALAHGGPPQGHSGSVVGMAQCSSSNHGVHPHSGGTPMSSGTKSRGGGGGGTQNQNGGGGGILELEPWPMRRVVYHAAEWLQWLGCEEAAVAALGITREAEAEGVGVGIFR